ncbi:MAG: envelope biogenesis factor ElyC [Proteobacteria bacterium]|nr:envelope biogenesis factor ElyC [Desulfobacterales bacterium]MBL6968270.1 envelope biogenesis factor ElyC [Desulfobacteraceae bacterium]MBU1903152.1 envelope biogenesis factor ElyC [Pseudomonadota bacterium]
MFLLKKILGSFFLPLPLCLLISFLGLFLLWRGKREVAGKILVTIGLVALTFFSYDPVSNALNDPLKGKFSPYMMDKGSPASATKANERVKYVVVLGGGQHSDPSIPVTGQLTRHSMVRLMEGIRIFRQNPGSKLIVSGCGAFDPIPEAHIMAEVATFIGIDRNQIILEPASNDTEDQARLIKSIVANHPFVLVTSAVHMPRAVALFRKQGMDPIPAPAGQTASTRQVLTPKSFFPNSSALEDASCAVHEYMGLIWAKLRGQI